MSRTCRELVAMILKDLTQWLANCSPSNFIAKKADPAAVPGAQRPRPVGRVDDEYVVQQKVFWHCDVTVCKSLIAKAYLIKQLYS